MAERRDHRELIDLLEVFLLGEEPSLSGQQLADEVGITFDEARLRWRSLGFSAVGADVTAFTKADEEALRLTGQPQASHAFTISNARGSMRSG